MPGSNTLLLKIMTELLKINVSEHIEKKNGLSYLSWAWAWAEVLKVDPKAKYEVRMFGDPFGGSPVCMIGETAMVCVVVTVNDLPRECWLPVMDNRNNAIKNPDARKVSDTIMRCMTKAVALHGLGLYIYAGEDLPEQDNSAELAAQQAIQNRKAELEELALYMIDCHKNEKDMDAINVWYAPETFTDDNSAFDSNEQRKFVWGLLKAESKLRSAIKSNNPNITEQKAA